MSNISKLWLFVHHCAWWTDDGVLRKKENVLEKAKLKFLMDFYAYEDQGISLVFFASLNRWQVSRIFRTINSLPAMPLPFADVLRLMNNQCFSFNGQLILSPQKFVLFSSAQHNRWILCYQNTELCFLLSLFASSCRICKKLVSSSLDLTVLRNMTPVFMT